MYTENLVEIIKRGKALAPEDLERAKNLSQENGKKLLHVLVDEGLVTDRDLAVILSTELKIPVLNLNAFKIDPKVVEIVPKKLAERYEIIPISKIGNTITIAMSDPLDVFAI